MAKTTSSPIESLLTATRRFSRANWERGQTIAVDELSRTELYLMWMLENWPEPQGAKPSELAKRLSVSASSVAQQLRNLENRQLLERQHDSADRRVVLVKMTAAGEKKMKQIRTHWVSQYENLTQHLGKNDTENFIRLLTRAANFLETEGQS